MGVYIGVPSFWETTILFAREPQEAAGRTVGKNRAGWTDAAKGIERLNAVVLQRQKPEALNQCFKKKGLGPEAIMKDGFHPFPP